jgi:AraC family transcriptional regulator
MTSTADSVQLAARSVEQGPTLVEFPPGATFGPRMLHDYEFVWVLRGSATCTIEAPGHLSRRFVLAPGRLLLSQPGMTDEYRWTTDAVSQHAYVHFSLVTDPPAATRFGWPLTQVLTADDPMASVCRYLAWLPSSNDPRAASAIRTSIEFLLHLFVVGPMPVADSDVSRHVNRIADWLSSRWRAGGVGPVGVAELASGVGLSPGHLSRICRAEFGVGPAEVVELLRLGRAAVLLQRSNLSVAQVADACGFVDPFHFSRRFRRAYGIPPRTFRAAGERGFDVAPLARAGLLPLANHVITDDAAMPVGFGAPPSPSAERD